MCLIKAFGLVLDRLNLVFILIAVLQSLAEVGNCTAQFAANFRYAANAKQQNDNHQDNQQFSRSKTWHDLNSLSTSISAIITPEPEKGGSLCYRFLIIDVNASSECFVACRVKGKSIAMT